MRHVGPAAFTILLLATLLFPQCSRTDAAPTTAPADGTVLLLPFVALNQTDPQPWLGKSIQQSILADLTAAAPGRVITADDQASDTAAALDAGRKAGAHYVVRGAFVSAGQDVRVTGEILNVQAGAATAVLKATGSAANIFMLEDELSNQIRPRLIAPASRTSQPQTPVATDQVVPAFGPLRLPSQSLDSYREAYASPAPNSQSADRAQLEYNYYYSTPDVGYFAGTWGWPWAGWGVYGYPYISTGYSSYSHNWRGFRGPGTRWNGSYAAGIANSVGGTPLGGVGTLYGGLRTFDGPGLSFHLNFNSGSTHASIRSATPAASSPRSSRASAPAGRR